MPSPAASQDPTASFTDSRGVPSADDAAIRASLGELCDRLNRLSTLRLALRLGSLALAVVVGAVLVATWLDAESALGAWFLLALGAVAGSIAVVRRWRRDAMDPRAAGGFVEAHTHLDERLLTWVSLSPAAATNDGRALWPSLVRDNLTHLAAWQPVVQGIPRWPRGDVAMAVLALLFALPVLWPALRDASRASFGQATPGSGAVERRSDPLGVAATGPSQVARLGTAGGVGAENAESSAGGAAGGLAGAAAGVGSAETLGAGGVGGSREGQDMGAGGEPLGSKGAGPAGLGGRDLNGLPVAANQTKAKPEAGGRLPEPGLEQRDVGDDGRAAAGLGGASNQAGGQVTVRQGKGGSTKAGTAAGSGAAPPGAGPLDGGKPAAPDPKGGKGSTSPSGEPAGASGTASGGGKAGGGAATDPLLAAKPLALGGAGARTSTRFEVALGASAGEGVKREGKGTMIAEPVGRVASGTRGPQEAERGVRHEAIPAEYEPIIKRIFTREP